MYVDHMMDLPTLDVGNQMINCCVLAGRGGCKGLYMNVYMNI